METLNKKQIKINWDFISFLILVGLAFLLPIFVWPLEALPLAFPKAFLVYFAISLAFIFWLIARLRKGEVKIPQSLLLLSVGVMVVVWLISSLVSDNIFLSLVGRGHEIGTFVFLLFLSLALFLISVTFQSEKRGVIFYFLIFVSALIVFLFQIFHTLLGVNIIPLKIFPSITSNLIGSWNDFAIFFGFVGLVSLVFLELFSFKKWLKAILCSMIVFSLLAMMAVNLYANWIVFGFFVLTLFIYIFSKSFFVPKTEIEISVIPAQEEESVKNKKKKGLGLFRLSFLVLLIVLLFILVRSLNANFADLLKTASIEVRPSWTATWEIVRQSLRIDPILGSGPNTFLFDWLKFKPLVINTTLFWNIRFLSGVGHLPSLLATTGILGGLALFALLVFLISYGMKALSYSYYQGQNDLLQTLLAASFLGSVYLWVFTLIYSPGFLIFALAFLNTGLFIALLVRAEKIKNIEFSFLDNPKIGFILVLVTVVLLLGSASSLYFFFQKARAAGFYNQAIKIFNTQGNIDETETQLLKAVQLDNQDEYLRALTEVDLLRIQEVLSRTDLPAEEARSRFQNALSAAISNAQQATRLNSQDPLNWMEIGRVYEAIIPLKITGADAMAISSYEQAFLTSPFDPTPLLAAARVEVQVEKTKEARDYLQAALSLKGDFAPAIFLLSQIEAREGNLKEAIARTEETAYLEPNDIGVLFQLGLLYYQNNNLEGARLAFERAVSLNENYANARYFLGLIYDRTKLQGKALEQFEIIAKSNPDNEEIKKIIVNLKAGKNALDGVSPPAKAPQERDSPPVTEQEETDLEPK